MASKTALLLLGCSATAEAFIVPSLPAPALRRSGALSASGSSLKMVSAGKKSWQEIAEKLGNPFVPPQDKPALLQELLDAERREEIRDSVTKVLRREVAPEEELLGPIGRKQVSATRDVQRQIVDDIIPNTIKEIQELADEASSRGPPTQEDIEQGLNRIQGLVAEQLDDISANGRLPAPPTPDELEREVRNIFQGTPEGLETPPYTVISTGEDFEIREYEGFMVASRDTPSGTLNSGGSFNTLATYLFGRNSKNQAMEMTTPVFMTKDEGGVDLMQFVIPKEDAAAGVPAPVDDSVRLEEVPSALYAVREFPGFVTDAEIKYQKAKLLASIEAAGYSPLSQGVTVAQYNPPYTLPTYKRNEVMVKVEGSGSDGAVCPSADYLNKIDGKGKKYGEYAAKEFPNWGEEGASMSMENPAMAMVGKTSKEELARRMSVQLQQAAGTW